MLDCLSSSPLQKPGKTLLSGLKLPEALASSLPNERVSKNGERWGMLSQRSGWGSDLSLLGDLQFPGWDLTHGWLLDTCR